jgi:hypothetical protein
MTAYQNNIPPTTRNTQQHYTVDPNKINIIIINLRVSKQKKSAGGVVPVLSEAPRDEDVWESGDRAPHILNFGTGWR